MNNWNCPITDHGPLDFRQPVPWLSNHDNQCKAHYFAWCSFTSFQTFLLMHEKMRAIKMKYMFLRLSQLLLALALVFFCSLLHNKQNSFEENDFLEVMINAWYPKEKFSAILFTEWFIYFPILKKLNTKAIISSEVGKKF